MSYPGSILKPKTVENMKTKYLKQVCGFYTSEVLRNTYSTKSIEWRPISAVPVANRRGTHWHNDGEDRSISGHRSTADGFSAPVRSRSAWSVPMPLHGSAPRIRRMRFGCAQPAGDRSLETIDSLASVNERIVRSAIRL